MNTKFIKALFLIIVVISLIGCHEPKKSNKTGYELDWMASEIEQDDAFVMDGQSMPVLTVRFINHTKEHLGILVEERLGLGAFYLKNESEVKRFYSSRTPKIRRCPPSDTIYLYLGTYEEHARIIADEDVEKLLPGKLYYWPDPKYLKPGVLGDSIEIKKVDNFHSATCPSGKPLYRKLYPDKSP